MKLQETLVGFALAILLATSATATPPTIKGEVPPSPPSLRQWDNDVYVNANRILMFVTNHGNFGRDLSDVFGYDAGTFYPYPGSDDHEMFVSDPDKQFALFSAGLWIGGRVNGQPRVTVAEYADEYIPGPMENGTFLPDQPDFRVYKLYHDSLASNPNQDYLNWPVDQGAPFKVANGDSVPAIKGHQTLWTVFNDADPAQHDNDAGQTPPLGVEVQQTVWAAEGSQLIDSAVISQTAQATHTGPGSGRVEAVVTSVGPVTGHQYQVVFSASSTWSLVHLNTHETVLSNMPVPGQGSADGLLVRVFGAEAGVDSIIEVANADGPLNPPEDVKYSLNSTDDWFISSDQGDNFARMNWRGHIGTSSWEFRFTDQGSQYYDWSTDQAMPDRAPFEVWNIGIQTPADPSDDRRINFAILDDDMSGDWSYGDRIYPIETDYVEPVPQTAEYDFDGDLHIGRIVYRDHSSITSAPETGTVVRFTTFHQQQLSPADTFTFQVPAYQVIVAGGESQAIFLEYKLHNRGANTITDCYLSLWADPDLGDAADDFVGCDTLNDLFFCYNSDNDDSYYGGNPPALGFKILHGPLVPSPFDSAQFAGRWVPGHRNLPMTAFSMYINGTDPNDHLQSYNFMQGLQGDGSPWPNGSKYALPGDPVAGTGNLDSSPSDRRMMGSMGPFDFNPGDSQYVLIKMAIGHGYNRLQSISKLKEILNIPAPTFAEHKAVHLPDPLLLASLNLINPVTARVLIGYDYATGFGAAIDYNTIAINGLPTADSTTILPSYPGFAGEVLCYYYNPIPLLSSFGVIWNTFNHPFTVSGNYSSGSPFAFDGVVAIRGHRNGDFNMDGDLNVGDLTSLVNNLFRGGPPPRYVEAGDADESGTLNIGDVTALVGFLFQ